MTVKEFEKQFNKYKNGDMEEMDKFLQAVVPDEKMYISYAQKLATCQNIIDATYYIYETNEDGERVNPQLHVNSAATYMLYHLSIINLYTNIEVDFKDPVNEFDAINRNGSIDVIMSRISERELKELQMMLNMVEDDTMQNEYEIHAYINNQVERFGRLTGIVVSPLLEELTKQISTMDDKKVDKIINKVKEFIPKK